MTLQYDALHLPIAGMTINDITIGRFALANSRPVLVADEYLSKIETFAKNFSNLHNKIWVRIIKTGVKILQHCSC